MGARANDHQQKKNNEDNNEDSASHKKQEWERISISILGRLVKLVNLAAIFSGRQPSIFLTF